MAYSKYWEEEQPIVVVTDKNVLRWYKEAGKLQVCLGEEKPSGKVSFCKVTTMDVNAVKEFPAAMALIKAAFLDDEEQLNQLNVSARC